IVLVMAVTHSWEAAFAERTRTGAGDGIAAILGLVANPDLISFAGGFPDPRTFPISRVAELVGVPVRADERPRRNARRGRGAPRPASGGRGADDHERRDRGPRARREVVP